MSEIVAQRNEPIKVVHQQVVVGPLPPPELLAAYENIVPGAANRLLTSAEERAKHRQSVEKTALYYHGAAHLVGVSAPHLTTTGALCICAYLLTHGYDTAGYITMLVPLAFLVAALVGRKPPTQNNDTP